MYTCSGLHKDKKSKISYGEDETNVHTKQKLLHDILWEGDSYNTWPVEHMIEQSRFREIDRKSRDSFLIDLNADLTSQGTVTEFNGKTEIKDLVDYFDSIHELTPRFLKITGADDNYPFWYVYARKEGRYKLNITIDRGVSVSYHSRKGEIHIDLLYVNSVKARCPGATTVNLFQFLAKLALYTNSLLTLDDASMYSVENSYCKISANLFYISGTYGYYQKKQNMHPITLKSQEAELKNLNRNSAQDYFRGIKKSGFDTSKCDLILLYLDTISDGKTLNVSDLTTNLINLCLTGKAITAFMTSGLLAHQNILRSTYEAHKILEAIETCTNVSNEQTNLFEATVFGRVASVKNIKDLLEKEDWLEYINPVFLQKASNSKVTEWITEEVLKGTSIINREIIKKKFPQYLNINNSN